MRVVHFKSLIEMLIFAIPTAISISIGRGEIFQELFLVSSLIPLTTSSRGMQES
jgi:hypothetical protein